MSKKVAVLSGTTERERERENKSAPLILSDRSRPDFSSLSYVLYSCSENLDILRRVLVNYSASGTTCPDSYTAEDACLLAAFCIESICTKIDSVCDTLEELDLKEQ